MEGNLGDGWRLFDEPINPQHRPFTVDDGPVESVFGYTATNLRKIEAEDVGVAVLKFKSGALGVIEASTTIYPENLEETLAIFGEKGTVVLAG
ncbi:MAG: hypothetical protein RJR35_01275 [Thermoanaerobacterales bacterium]|nr:hypothetical protein [Thermoanaerobacterales bacterium]